MVTITLKNSSGKAHWNFEETKKHGLGLAEKLVALQ
jgi:hypothetical protein